MSLSVTVGGRLLRVPDRVFLDSSFIVSLRLAADRHHTLARIVFVRLVQGARDGEVALFVSPRVLDEVWWVMARLLWEEAHGPRSWARLGKTDRQAAFRACAAELTAVTGGLTSSGVVTVTDVLPEDVVSALRLVTQPHPSLDPADAFHVAVMNRRRVTGIVTKDSDFQGLPGLTVIRFDGP